MKNEMNWQCAENGGFPMRLAEKGLDFKGRTAFFFYFSGLVAVLSMIWVIILSVKLLQFSRVDPNLPSYYTTVAMLCIGISAASLYSFYKLFATRSAYRKNIEIADGTVSFSEVTSKGTREWKEKLRKFEGLTLRHYDFRGVSSWYIALMHADKERCFPVFTPDYDSRLAPETEKRELLARYGSMFNLITTYEKPEESKKE
ncbi:MAG: hypothetical protein PHD82_04705 [Candidatus Riflebacteria bacterium]|jgi:hypothetical protein|nr:hypothetical protein [Candidatus Riflebacteria bacterium]